MCRYKEKNSSQIIDLKKNKKPNYLMKRYFIKDKSIFNSIFYT